MFPHTITIYHHDIYNGADRYTKYVVDGVYWNGTKGISAQGNGIANENSVSIITSKNTTDNYGVTWNVENNDRIIKGAGGDITKFSDLTGAITVKGITENICGSDLDNIVIIGA